MPPAGAAKSLRCVSIRPEVQAPFVLSAVMLRWLLPSTETFFVELLMVSTSPVPQLAGPPGELVPVSSIQILDEGALTAVPAKLSRHTVVQLPGGGVGVEIGPVVGVAVGLTGVGVGVGVETPVP